MARLTRDRQTDADSGAIQQPSLREDASRLRKGPLTRAIAAFGNLAL